MADDHQKRKRGEEDRESQCPSKFLIFGPKPIAATSPSPIYSCKTCKKEFSSFQALGGHNASHSLKNGNSSSKPHECETCHRKFNSGQALGGHMRKHWSKPRKDKGKTVSSAGSTSPNAMGCKEKSEEVDGPRGHNSALVARDFFPMEPMRANPDSALVIPVLKRVDSWLEFKLAYLGGELNRKRDVDREAQPKPITATDLYRVLLCKACKDEFFNFLACFHANSTLKTGADLAPMSSSGKSPECHICLEKAKFKAFKAGSTSQSDLGCEEKSVGEEGSKGDNSVLVTRNFFPMEPMWANPEKVEVVPVLERSDSWLDFKLAPLGGDLNRRRD